VTNRQSSPEKKETASQLRAPSVSETDIRLRPYRRDDEYLLNAEDRGHSPENHPCMMVEFRGLAIGFHLLKVLDGEQAQMHTRFWDAGARGRGITAISVFKACQQFFDQIPQLQRLIFVSAADNPFSDRIADAGVLTRADFDRLQNWEEPEDEEDEDL
jgi:hypothetical protein